MTRAATSPEARRQVLTIATDCVARVRVDGGSVSLVSSHADRMVLSATDSCAADLERAQTDLGEGPFIDAAAGTDPVLVPDLRRWRTTAGWPFFAEAAARLEVSAVFAFPIRVSHVLVGTLGLYRHRPGALSGPALGVARDAVDEITEALLGSGVSSEILGATDWSPHVPPPRVDGAGGTLPVASTVQLHQAAGMVMVQLDVTILEALAVLRATAFTENIALADLAHQIVTRRRRLREERDDA